MPRKDRELRLKYGREQQRTAEGKAVHAKSGRKYRIGNAQKYKATNAVNNAVRDGRLIKQSCEVCGESKSQAHHDDYEKMLEVRWLCDKHHKEVHKNA